MKHLNDGNMRTLGGAMLCAVLLVGGCGPVDDLFNYDPCDISNSQGEPEQVDGTWRLTGTGTWSGCDNGVRDDTAFDLNAPPLQVVQSDDPDDVTRDILTLNGGPNGFEFTGEVRGSCVEVRTIDRTTAEEIAFTFKGSYSTRHEITGEFTGTGPGDCRSDGDFEIDID